MEEASAAAMLAAVLGLIVREFFAYLRSRKPAGEGNPGNPGNPHPIVDTAALEGKLDRIVARLDDILDVETQNRKTLASIAETTETSARKVARFEESLLRLERAHRERLREAAEAD